MAYTGSTSGVSFVFAVIGGLAGLRKNAPPFARIIGWMTATVGVFLLLVIVGIGAGIH